jgi:hypothetical protein
MSEKDLVDEITEARLEKEANKKEWREYRAQAWYKARQAANSARYDLTDMLDLVMKTNGVEFEGEIIDESAKLITDETFEAIQNYVNKRKAFLSTAKTVAEPLTDEYDY